MYFPHGHSITMYHHHFMLMLDRRSYAWALSTGNRCSPATNSGSRSSWRFGYGGSGTITVGTCSPFSLSEYVGWSQKYLCREFREKMPKKFPVLLNMWTSGGFVAAEIRTEAIEQSKRDNQLESRNRFAMICVIESMDHLILGIPSMVMAAT